MKKKPVNYRLEAEVVANLEAASKMSGVDKTELLETALDLFFAANKISKRKSKR